MLLICLRLIITIGLVLSLSANAFASSTKAESVEADYVGTDQCRGCHENQYQAWDRSHHAKSMLPASESSVLGDFNNARATHEGKEARFYRRGEAFYIHAPGIAGKSAEFKIEYTFGVKPLQQYLVSFPDGKIQTLPWTWDTEKKRWYHVQSPVPEHDDWLHWTNGAMNWNAMCSDCHSTKVQKHYEPESDSYNTQWAEVNVGCEACHGPGKSHVEVTQKGGNIARKDLAILMGGDIPSASLIDQCGRCHSRRLELTSSFDHSGNTMLDHYLPQVLTPGLYHSDGQINDEVFVYGSFTQSSKFTGGLNCRNCHDSHSGELLREGNALCTSCHVEQDYDVEEHHRHQLGTEGAQCVDCHMPGKLYMGVNFRRDHSFRVPRPDLSLTYGIPNACNDCHEDKGADWASDQMVEWYGEKRTQHYSDVLTLASVDLRAAIPQLVELLEDREQPAIVRATAVFWLTRGMQLEVVQKAVIKAIEDHDPLVRFHAISALEQLPAAQRIPLLLPALTDPVRAVRIAAASGTTRAEDSGLSKTERDALEQARDEQWEYFEQNADLPSGQLNQAVHFEKLGQWDKAEAAYRKALIIDNRDTASRINLANLLYRQKKYQQAVSQFEEAIKYQPGFGPAYYSLGLLLAELKDYKKAEHYLSEAAARLPGNERIQRNLDEIRRFLRQTRQ